MVVHVTRDEADDLNIRTGKTEFLGCWILEAICAYTNEEMYSSLTVVRRVVKLTQEDDVACLHKQVYEWQGHKVVFMKVHRIELLRDVLDDVHGKVHLVSNPN